MVSAPDQPRSDGPIRLAFVVHDLDAGGFEKVLLNLLERVDRRRFGLTLVLLNRAGAWADRVPNDVKTVVIGKRTIRTIAPLARCLSDAESQVVFCGTTAANLATLAATLLMRKKPQVVVNEHTTPGLSLREHKLGTLFRTGMRWLYPRAARVGVPIRAVGTELRQVLNRPRLPIVELLNPVFDDALPQLVKEEPSFAWPAGPVLVAAGRLVPAKAFDVLLEAFSRLRAKTAEPTLVILGEGPERAALEAQRERLGLTDRVLMPGTVANPFSAFSRARALVLSSRREAAPNVVVEAMACETPVIVTDICEGVRQIVQDGDAGLLVPGEDPEALAEAMYRVLTQPGLVDRLVAGGRARAGDFDVRKTVPRFEALFEELAG